MANEYTTLRVSSETKQRFDNHGKKGQSSDELLNQILDVFESEKGFVGE